MLYLELADGSLYPWEGTLEELEEKVWELLERGYSVNIRLM